MNKKRVLIALAVVVGLVWAAVIAVKALRSPRVVPAVVVTEVVKQLPPVPTVEAPYVVTKTATPAPAPAPQCKADPKLMPKKVQPKAKLIAPSPQPIVKARPSARLHGDRAPVLLPN